MGPRSDSRAHDAMRRLEEEGLGKGEVEYLKMDLASLKDSKRAAEDFLSKERKLDILGQ
jgi:NAD(P)-dependent dehydrogenase (short-subunit alcohol dehydrogenase family)